MYQKIIERLVHLVFMEVFVHCLFAKCLSDRICCHIIWQQAKKGSPVRVAPACIGSGEGSDHFGSYVCILSLHFCKRLFLGHP
jgi:hypothetical protein